MEDVRKKFIARLAAARTALGITQAELARRVGTQASNISRLESGKYNPSLDFLLRVAQALGLELSFDVPGAYGEPGALDAMMVAEEGADLYGADRPDDKEVYELRLYDTTLATFQMDKDELGELTVRLLSSDKTQEKRFPLDLDFTDEGILKWLERRVIPKNRTFVEEILHSLGLAENDTKGIIDICKGLSLNDSYWVVPQGFTGTFSQYNLYENRFSEALSLIAYTGYGPSDRKFTTSPELTTNGMLPKAWRLIEGVGIYLYKGGTSGFANTGNEPYSEYYAHQVAMAMGVNAVRYDLEKWKGILASKCPLFTNVDTAYVPIGRIVKTGGLKACLDYLENVGDDLAEAMRDMLVFDAVVYNEDRHFGNFGILRDNLYGGVKGFAPLFDHGMSLFNFGMPDEFKNLEEYAATRGPAYRGTTFEAICAGAKGKRQSAKLRRLFDFRFHRHEKYNLPEERLEAIERHIRKRAQQLLQL